MNSLPCNSTARGIPAAPPARRLEGKVAVITGGASGIGEATVRLFIQHGARVVVADIQDELGLSLCKDIGCGSEESITYVHCDVTCDSDVQNAVHTAVSKYGKLDIMYNNAGITGEINFDVTKANNDDFKRVLDVNVFGAFLGAKHAARVMIPAANRGCILFTASVSSILGGDVPHGYVTSKHALVGLMKNLSAELGQYGIRVNAISPYGVATPLFTGLLGGMGNEQAEQVASAAANLKGIDLKATHIADAALYLASNDAEYVSGLNLVVDGGYTKKSTSFGHALKNLAAAFDGSSIINEQ